MFADWLSCLVAGCGGGRLPGASSRWFGGWAAAVWLVSRCAGGPLLRSRCAARRYHDNSHFFEESAEMTRGSQQPG